MTGTEPVVYNWLEPITVCRPAREADTRAVKELTRLIWDGNDYVPRVWADWLQDPHGLLAVAEYGGRVAGLIKLTRAGEDQWWMEGLRVDPELRGKGIAARLFDYLVDVWTRTSAGPVRLLTKRPQVQHMSDRSGFHKVGDYVNYSAPAEAEHSHAFTRLTCGENGWVIDRLLAPKLGNALHGLVDVGWSWIEPQAEPVQKAISEGRAWNWRGGEGVLIFGEDDDDGRAYPQISTVDCAPEMLTALLRDYRRLAANLGYGEARWTAPINDAVVVAGLVSAGFNVAWDDTLYVYEKTQH